MKSFVIALLLSSPYYALIAQTYPEPEYNLQPTYYDQAKKSLVQLEKNQMMVGSRSAGYAKAESYVAIPGLASSVRLPMGVTLTFLMKYDGTDDPDVHVDLDPFQVNKNRGQREAITATAGAFKGTQTENKSIPLYFKKVKTNLYLVELKDLKPGEYTFSTSQKQLYSFGIDGNGTTAAAAPAQSQPTSAATASTSKAVPASAAATAPKGDMPPLKATIDWLIKNTVEVTVEDVRYTQKLERETEGEDCKLKLTVTQTSAKGVTSTEVFTFNLKDIDDKTVEFVVKGKLLVIEAQTTISEGTTRQKLIHHTKDGQMMNYDNGIRIIMPTPEKGGDYSEALRHASSECKLAKKSWFSE